MRGDILTWYGKYFMGYSPWDIQPYAGGAGPRSQSALKPIKKHMTTIDISTIPLSCWRFLTTAQIIHIVR